MFGGGSGTFGSVCNYILYIKSGKDEHGLERSVGRGCSMDRQIEGSCLEKTFGTSLGLMRGVGFFVTQTGWNLWLVVGPELLHKFHGRFGSSYPCTSILSSMRHPS